MKLKGTTKIELTDVYTGKKEIYRDTNMVTKAVQQVFGTNMEGVLFNINGTQIEHVDSFINRLQGIVITFLKILFLQILKDRKEICKLLWPIIWNLRWHRVAIKVGNTHHIKNK